MFDLVKEIIQRNDSKIVLLVMDGLGGIPLKAGGKSELESAIKPNINRLAGKSSLGLIQMVGTGITPGSGAGHLALFGYDPLKYRIGRGVLSAVGLGLDVKQGDVCLRGNFATLEKGVITDRRAGRISTSESSALCKVLSTIKLDVDFSVKPEKEHRFVIILKGNGLGAQVSDTDSQKEGRAPLDAIGKDSQSEKTASIVNDFVIQAKEKLKDTKPANFVLMRGCASLPDLESFQDLYKLNPAVIGTYPMYRGLAKLVGMKVLETSEEEDYSVLAKVLKENYSKYDFFFIHVKKADSYGEDGNFEKKTSVIESVDKMLVSEIVNLSPDVFAITGDHSTPAVMKGHSWHPVPFLLFSKYTTFNNHSEFGESECSRGMLGLMPATQVMALLLAHSGRFAKFGA